MIWAIRGLKFGFWGLSFLLTCAISSSAVIAARLSEELYAFASFSEQLDTAWQSTLQLLSFGIYRGGSDRQAEIQGLLDQLASVRSYHSLSLWLFLGLALFFLVFLFVRLRQNKPVSKALVWFSALLLLPGLFAPMLSVAFFQDVPVLGAFVFDYHARGILASISELFSQGYWFIALVLFLFSVVTPILKLVVLGFLSHASNSLSFNFVDRIAKWSMLDVFVVAILISVFVLGASSFSEASAGLGLYFFTAYCVLSLFTTQLVRHETRLNASLSA